MKGPGIARRLLLAFALLALGMGLTLGLVGHFSYDLLGRYLVEWHTRPVMQALIEAEQRAWRAEDMGSRHLYYGSDLADSMHWQFLVGKQIPPVWGQLPDGLHFLLPDRDFVLLVQQGDVRYALSGPTGPLQALKARLEGILLFCALAGLAVAIVLALVLARRLTGPVRRLTEAVQTGEKSGALRAGSDCAASGTGQQAEEFCHIEDDLLALPDEVGVLARALAAREAALQRFLQRETAFTGDVSHELRTPLMVMQSGLEVLEMRLQALEADGAGGGLLPVVQRLLQTSERMAGTVRSLLLLARRPEELDTGPLDLPALVQETVAEAAARGLLRLSATAPGQVEPCQAASGPVEYGQAEPGRIKAGQGQAGQMEPGQTGPGQTVQTEPGQGESGRADSVQAEPRQTAALQASPAPSRGQGTGRSQAVLWLQLPGEPLPTVQGQNELARIVIKNLLDNACRYTEDGRVSVQLHAGGLQVSNRGCIPGGLDIFARGVRGERAGQAVREGSGLGLSLALRACERLGWRLEHHTAQGGMNHFCVLFPGQKPVKERE